MLRFHKISEDKAGSRSGKCNAYFTGNEEDVVIGVVFDIDRNEKPSLAAAEVGYAEEPLKLTSRGKDSSGFMFTVADGSLLDDTLQPYDWYKALVLAGAREHNLPTEYVSALENIATVQDPDTARAKRNPRFLS